MTDTTKKILIAYYSRKGQNYLSGQIVDLSIGNTEVIASKIQKLTGGDLFEIKTVKSYPEDYDETTKVVREELQANARPALVRLIDNIDEYEVIYLGYPNWWGTFPMAVFSFLESADFSGKTIIPFCTNEGSGMGHSESDIKELCPSAKILSGITFLGTGIENADKRIEDWVINNG